MIDNQTPFNKIPNEAEINNYHMSPFGLHQ